MADGKDAGRIRESVRARYAEAAGCAEGLFGYPTGAAGAEGLDYPRGFIADAPGGILDSFCGVGNPFALGPLNPGETVLDIGCGAGFDLYCATRLVGSRGLAFGIDLTPAMTAKAGRNFSKIGAGNVALVNGISEALPFKDEIFDVGISNGVLNLSTDKTRSFSEIFRVLKPGGRFQAADVLLRNDPPPGELSAESWSD